MFLNFVFIQSAISYDQVLNPEFDRPFHHVENCMVCHDITKLQNGLPLVNGNNHKGIRNVIATPNSGNREVVFVDRNDSDHYTDYANGDNVFNGICEVCHTQNNHHRNDGSDNTWHFDGQRCTACHLHENEFAPPVQQAHRTHLDYRGKGPLIQDCTVCHTPPIYNPGTTDTNTSYQYSNDANYSVVFRDGKTLATTEACNNCHSPWGAYPGGVESEALMLPTTGAKANFRTGIYEADGYTLKAGKEKWCITCHDDRPSTSAYDSDPDPGLIISDIIMDNTYAGLTFQDGDQATTGWTDKNWGALHNWNDNPPGVWAKWTFDIVQDGSYTVSMKRADTDANCNTLDKGKTVEVTLTDSSGVQTFQYEQNGAGDGTYEKITDFNITTGTGIELKMLNPNDGVWCTLVAGHIEIKANTGSGGSVVLAPMIAGDNETWGFYATGHGVGGVHCTECHDPRKKHIDYEHRTHEMNTSVIGNVVNPWGDSYRLQTKDPKSGEAICARCHDFRMIWDQGGSTNLPDSRSGQTNFGDDGNADAATGVISTNPWWRWNLHGYHMQMDYATSTSQGGDSDLDGIVDGSIRCANCHNVHGSTRNKMFRDGRLASNPYQTNKMPMKDIEWEIYAKAKWTPTLAGGDYDVSIQYPSGVAGAATTAAFYVNNSDLFTHRIDVNQTVGGGTWLSLGTYNFEAGRKGNVFVHSKDAGGNILADAVKFESATETVIIDNILDGNYTKYGEFLSTSDTGNYGTDYDYIASYVQSLTTVADTGRPLALETIKIHVPGVLGMNISENKLCYSCHGGGNTPAHRVPFTGPNIINRFESKRWVNIDGSEDAEIYVTVKDADDNITLVYIDLTEINNGVSKIEPMVWVEKQTFKYTITGSMIAAMTTKHDRSYKLPVYTDQGAQVGYPTRVTHETYLFLKDGVDTIYMDTNDVEIYDVNNFRFSVNTIKSDLIPNQPKTYFGPGYRFNVFDYGTGYGIWTPKIPKTGKYEVYALWDDLSGLTVKTTGFTEITLNSGEVKYTIHAANGTFEVIKDQSVPADAGKWVLIGTYNFLDDGSNYVKQASVAANTMVLDAMKFVRVNTEPLVRLSATQNEKTTRLIDNRTAKVVTISAIAKDYDTGDSPDTFTYVWDVNQSIADARTFIDYDTNSWYNSKYTFNPNNLAAGTYTIGVTVTDKNGAGLAVTNYLRIRVPDSYPLLLSSEDNDSDGITNDIEGFTDFDEDGIPNYLDNVNSASNTIPDSGSLTISTEEGFEINIGETAFKAGSVDGVLNYNTEFLPNASDGVGGLSDGATSIDGGLFDFDVLGLKSVGQSAKIVIPLQWGFKVPAGAVYKKYDVQNGWRSFTVDADNNVHTSLKVDGVCPPAGSTSYSTLLSDAGSVDHECIQLTIKDGGPNDADGLENAEIKDPGAMFGDSFNNNIDEDNGFVSYEKESKSSGGWGAFDIWGLLLLGMFTLLIYNRRKESTI